MTVEFHPCVGAGQRMIQSFQMEFPIAESEVEIVLPVAR
jgi:hypothetical protein